MGRGDDIRKRGRRPHLDRTKRDESHDSGAGFGRTISEAGAIIPVGGNIRGLTRTMTTAIALQTSEG